MFDFPNPPLTVGQQVTGPGGAVYQWDGTKWAALGGSATYVNKGGDTMTGALTLPGNASSALQAVPLQQLTGTVAPAWNDVGRNLVHNPLFNIWQRGTATFTANGLTADRWILGVTGDTSTISPATLSDANRTAIGDEAALYALYCTVNGTSTAGNLTQVGHSIENARRLSGKTVTVSFWAATGTNLSVGVRLYQNLGTGGTPSAGGNTAPQTFALTSTPTRYSATFSVPSVAGKTLGTNNDHSTGIYFGLSSGATNSATLGVGVQTGIVWFWGVQLEVGSVATQLEKPDPQQDLARCQRFYTVISQALAFTSYCSGVSSVIVDISFPTQMRATPSVNYANITYSNSSGINTNAVASNHVRMACSSSAAGNAYVIADILLSADL